MRNLLVSVYLTVWAALPQGARAESQDYSALVREAVAEYNAGNWGEARLLFGKAHDLQPNARTWRGMGLCDYESKRYVEAIRELEAALASHVKRLTDQQQAEAEGALERSKRFIAIYALSLPSDAGELRLDGLPVATENDGTLRLNPGEHVLSVRRASGAWIERRFEAEVGARGTLQLESQEPVVDTRAPGAGAADAEGVAASRDAGSGGRTWTWVACGGTVAFGAASVAFGLLALDANDEFKERALAGLPAESTKQDGQRYQLLANVGFGITAAAAITTAVLFVVEGPSDEDEPAQAKSVELQLGLGSIAVRGSL